MILKLNNKITNYNKSKRGFTLFTALVSLLLISITLVLIFNMVKTEETYLSLIIDQSATSDLMTIADLSRADAYNSFIVSLRYQWEDIKSLEDNPFILNRSSIFLSWDNFVQDVVNNHFFKNRFAHFFAQALLSKLKYSLDPEGYKVNIDIGNDDILQEDQQGFYDNAGRFKSIVTQMFDDGNRHVDIVNCDQESVDDCTGSFYLTLNTLELSDENYELLPKVTVLRFKNNEVIERPILGRQIYKIYMPWRGFQAFRTVRRVAQSVDVETSDNPVDSSDVGLFNAQIHNTLEQARLGVCDSGSCGYRTDFFKTTSSSGFSGLCTENVVANVANPNKQVLGANITLSEPSSNYQLHMPETYKELFKDLTSNVISSNIGQRLGERIYFNDGLLMCDGTGSCSTNDTDIKIYNIITGVDKVRTKQVLSDSQSVSPSGVSVRTFDIFNNSVLNTSAGGLGVFLDTDNNVLLAPSFNTDWYNSFDFVPGYDNADAPADLSCYELDKIELKFMFKETDIRYKVMDEPNQSPKIWVILRDNYIPFKFPKSNDGYGLSVDPLGYFSLSQENLAPTNASNWVCKSHNGMTPSCNSS